MLKQRVVTALVLVAALFLILFYLPSAYVVAVFAAIATVAAWEWQRLLSRASGPGRVVFPLVVAACAGLCLLYPQLQFAFCIIAAGFWLLAPLWFVNHWALGHGMFGYLVGTIVIVPAWIGMVQLHARGPWTLLAVMALIWAADIAAYFVGRAIGRHKLAPAVSPGKTWEGAIGAVAGGLLYVFLLRRYADVVPPLNSLLIVFGTVALVAVSIVGDLFESMIKRQAGVKDSSHLLPGHGGILDRIDSLTSTLPLLVVAIGFKLL